MKVRRVRAEDLWEVARIENQVFKKPWTFPRFISEYEDNQEGFLVAEENGMVRGFSITSTKGILMLIAVDPKHQGKGIGSKLLQKSVDFLKSLKKKKAFAHVRKSNEKVIDFYLSNGFKKEKLLKNYYSDENGWLLTKKL